VLPPASDLSGGSSAQQSLRRSETFSRLIGEELQKSLCFRWRVRRPESASQHFAAPDRWLTGHFEKRRPDLSRLDHDSGFGRHILRVIITIENPVLF